MGRIRRGRELVASTDIHEHTHTFVDDHGDDHQQHMIAELPPMPEALQPPPPLPSALHPPPVFRISTPPGVAAGSGPGAAVAGGGAGGGTSRGQQQQQRYVGISSSGSSGGGGSALPAGTTTTTINTTNRQSSFATRAVLRNGGTNIPHSAATTTSRPPANPQEYYHQTAGASADDNNTDTSRRRLSSDYDEVYYNHTHYDNRTCNQKAIFILCIIITILLGLCTILALTSAYLYQEVKEEEEEVVEEQEEIEHLENEVHVSQNLTVYHVAGTFTILGSIVTMFHMTAHLRHFNQPIIQRKILAILWMSPIYSITSWLSLAFPTYDGYFRILKDFYEAYLIYQFLSFLIAVLGRGDRDVVVEMLARRSHHLKPPVRCLAHCYYPPPEDSPEAMANAVLLECQVFAMQFVLIRPLTSILLFMFGGETGKIDPLTPEFYIVMLQNVSVFTAFTGLLKFYHAVHEDLEWIRPWPKFLCIKGVVFMTFWQGLIISILGHSGDGGADNEETTTAPSGERVLDWSSWVQNFLICFEMLLFSVAHFCYFPWEEWEDGYRERVSMMVDEDEGEDGRSGGGGTTTEDGLAVSDVDGGRRRVRRGHSPGRVRFGDGMALRDFAQDVQMVISSHKSSLKSRKQHRKEKALEAAASLSSSSSSSPTAAVAAGAAAVDSTNVIGNVDGEEEGNNRHDGGGGGGGNLRPSSSPNRTIEADSGGDETTSPAEGGGDLEEVELSIEMPPIV